MSTVRRIDNLGRVVIPQEMRKQLGIQKEDPVEIQMDGDTIVLQKFKPLCHLCGCPADELELAMVQENYICRSCREKLASN